MADEKVNASPEESKIPEAPAPSGPGDPPAPEHTEGPAVPGGDQTAPAHVEPAMPEKTEGPIKPEQSVIPGMGEDAPAPSGKVINLSDIQAADKGGKEASAPAPEKKAPEADKPPKRRGRPPKEQAGPTVEKKSKAAEPRTGRPSKVDKAAREEAPPSVLDKVSRGRNLPPKRAAFFIAGAIPGEMEDIWLFSLLLSRLCRLSLLRWALAWACGALSICWRATVPTTRAPMLMCHKVTHKNLIDGNPLFPKK